MRRIMILVYALAALCLCGCGVSGVDEQVAPTMPAPPTAAPAAPTAPPPPISQTLHIEITMLPEPTAMPKSQPTAAGSPAVDPALASFVERAKADLAQRQTSTIDAITVLEARSVTWPDPGLGCPKPGMVYKQVPVDGLLIRLSLGGQIFSYHGGGDSGKPPFLCQQAK